jgi:hypothetical protein
MKLPKGTIEPSMAAQSPDIQEFAEFIYEVWLDKPISVKMVKSLYGFVEQKVRNELVRELKDKGACSICGCSKNSFYE